MSENTPVQADEAASAPAPGAAEPSFVNDPVLSADLPQAAPEQKLTAGAAVTPPSAPEPAVHAGITVDERAYAQYQALAKAVLDSAEIASRSARLSALWLRPGSLSNSWRTCGTSRRSRRYCSAVSGSARCSIWRMARSSRRIGSAR